MSPLRGRIVPLIAVVSKFHERFYCGGNLAPKRPLRFSGIDSPAPLVRGPHPPHDNGEGAKRKDSRACAVT